MAAFESTTTSCIEAETKSFRLHSLHSSAVVVVVLWFKQFPRDLKVLGSNPTTKYFFHDNLLVYFARY